MRRAPSPPFEVVIHYLEPVACNYDPVRVHYIDLQAGEEIFGYRGRQPSHYSVRAVYRLICHMSTLPLGLSFASCSNGRHFPPFSSIFFLAEALNLIAYTVTFLSIFPVPRQGPGTITDSFSCELLLILSTLTPSLALLLLSRCLTTTG